MITYDRLWTTMKEKGISQYTLVKDYGIDKAQLQRLRTNSVVTTMTLDNLCRILDCRIEDILEYVPDESRVLKDIAKSIFVMSFVVSKNSPAFFSPYSPK